MKITKNRKATEGLVDRSRSYSLEEASELIGQLDKTKFNSSVDLHIRLGLDPKKPDQALRGTVSLPHGTGKTKTVLVFCEPEDEAAAKEAGADYYGLDEYIEKIEKGWTEIDVVIATPKTMPKIAKLGRVLGPRNLMPNPKVGTVTANVKEAVESVKKGTVSYRLDKFGIIHSSVGRTSFSKEQIYENALEVLNTISKAKPASAKGTYFKSVYMTGTMTPSIPLDTKSF